MRTRPVTGRRERNNKPVEESWSGRRAWRACTARWCCHARARTFCRSACSTPARPPGGAVLWPQQPARSPPSWQLAASPQHWAAHQGPGCTPRLLCSQPSQAPVPPRLPSPPSSCQSFPLSHCQPQSSALCFVPLVAVPTPAAVALQVLGGAWKVLRILERKPLRWPFKTQGPL